MAATGVGSDAAAIPGTTTASIDDQTVPTGTYYVTTTNTGTKPGGDTAGFLIVARTGVLAHQLYIDDTTSKVWSRAYSTSWTAWREVAYTDSPALTGTPTAPTASPNTNTTQVATTAYADAIAALKANIANPSFTGTASFGGTLGVTGAATFSNTVTITGNTTVGGGLASDDFVTIAFADDSNLVTTANQTGAIKIKLPVLYTTTQLSFTLSVNEGSSDSAFQMRISGHNRVSDNSWQFATATLIGNPGSKTPAIRYGNDGTTACIWIGELADVWTVPQIEVSNIHLGNSGLSATWLSGWAISFATTFDTVKTGPVTPFKTAGLASPAFTGTPAAPTANADTNTTQIATTAFVIGQASSTLPLINAVAAAIGTSLKYARADHVHPTDTTRAPVASPIFTGNPTAPTPADSDNSTSLATTAFVQTRLGFYAPLNSPALTGTPTAPTATIGDATTKIANTSFTQQTADNSAIVYSIVFG
jgi:hypothetical protein